MRITLVAAAASVVMTGLAVAGPVAGGCRCDGCSDTWGSRGPGYAYGRRHSGYRHHFRDHRSYGAYGYGDRYGYGYGTGYGRGYGHGYRSGYGPSGW